MATPTPKHPRNPTSPRPAPPDQRKDELVDPRWLLRALLIVLAVAAVLAYVTLCVLVYMGSRNQVLHPAKTVDRTPAAEAIPFEPIRFDAAATGTPLLTGWWVPATASPMSPAAAQPTILLLHDGTGSLSTILPLIALLHQASVNIFALDYRGFGLSAPIRPTQQTMQQDSAAALVYLTDTRHIPTATIVPLGNGLGAVLAAQLLAVNPALPAIIVDNPDVVTVPALEAAPRTRLLPMHLLLSDQFDLVTPLNALTRPRLLIVGGVGDTVSGHDHATEDFFNTVPAPRTVVHLPAPGAPASQACPACPTPGPAYIAAIHRFLDENVSTSQAIPDR